MTYIKSTGCMVGRNFYHYLNSNNSKVTVENGKNKTIWYYDGCDITGFTTISKSDNIVKTLK